MTHFSLPYILYLLYYQSCHYTFEIYTEYDHFYSTTILLSQVIKQLFSQQFSCSHSVSTLQSSLHTEARVILVKSRPDHITFLLKILISACLLSPIPFLPQLPCFVCYSWNVQHMLCPQAFLLSVYSI